MTMFKAWRVDKIGDQPIVTMASFDEADLMDGDVTVDVHWSTLNYKDGLALTSKSPVVRRFPMIPGIDFAGTVNRSSHQDWKPGDKVVCNGWGMGETHLGAFGEKARVQGDWLVRLPSKISERDAMAIGTAGYTSMLCVMALERHGLAPESGPVVITGAAGGVGSIAIAILAKLGYEVIASTGRPEETDYLKQLGASSVIDRAALAGAARPLNTERWIAGIDTVGSTTLANVLSMTMYGGTIAACGLAGGMDLPSSVAPFILRGISLLGIDSVRCPITRRRQAWERLATDLDLSKLAGMTEEVEFVDLGGAAERILAGKIRGRTVVRIQ